MSTLADPFRHPSTPSLPRQLGALCCPTDDATCRPAQAVPWLRLILGLFVAGQTMVLGLAINITPPESDTVRIVLQWTMLLATLAIMGLLGGPLLVESLRALRHRRLTMELLFLICLGGAFSISCQSMLRGTGPVYFEVVAVLLIVYSLGRSISLSSRRKALEAAAELFDALDEARVIDPRTRATSLVPVDTLMPKQRVLVTAGELIPVDGRIVKGSAFVQESAFTGEWSSTTRSEGDEVLAGTACLDGPIEVEATSAGRDRRIDRMASRIEEARLRPTSLQRQADRFVQWFLPLVCLTAAGTFTYWWQAVDLDTALFNALAVLLVACPCAAGLATPLVLWTVIGRLARQGLLLRGGDVLERMARIDSVIFDKTGTLGEDALVVENVEMMSGSTLFPLADVLAMIRTVEAHAHHPVAEALRMLEVPAKARAWELVHTRILPGRGIEGEVKLANEMDSATHVVSILQSSGETRANRRALTVRIDGRDTATVILRERLRDQAAGCIAAVKQFGLNVRIMTGDTEAGAASVESLAATDAAMTPEAKQKTIESLRHETSGFSRPLFVGDGLNDAPAMSASYVGMALARGAPLTVETASATLHQPDLDLIPRSIALARRAVRLVRSHLHWAVMYNLVGMVAAAMGYLHPVLAALLMACSSLLVSWRSFRLTEKLSDAPEPLPEKRLSSAASALIVEENPRKLARLMALHTVGIVGQGLVLALIGGWSLGYVLIAVGVFMALASLTLLAWPHLPAWADMTYAMVTLGGLGMNLGWWADLDFGPATSAFMCPCQAGNDTAHVFINWMNAGMLLFGVPAMYLVRRIREPFDLRRWCCSGMIVLGIPGMVIGMVTGSRLAHHFGAGLPIDGILVLDYVLMMIGMCVGMLVPHMLEYAFPRRWRTTPAVEPVPRTGPTMDV